MDETMVNRRSFVKGLGLMGGVAAMGMIAGCSSEPAAANDADPKEQPQAEAQPSVLAEGASWELVAHVEDGGLIEGLNFSQDGTLWFIDVVKGRIHKVVDGEAVTVHDNEGKSMPNGAKFIDGTTMLITDRSQGLCRYDTETGEYSVWVPNFNGTPFNGLNDLVLDGQGGAYFTDPGQSDYFKRIGCVYYVKYDEGEPVLQLIQDGIAYPNGITLSPDGQFIYVAEFNTNSLVCIPSAAYTLGRATPYVFARMDGGHGPDGITVDADGNIYVAHLEAKEVLVFDKNGFQIERIPAPEDADIFVDNLCIHNGYLYICEFGSSNIYCIAVTAETGEK